MHLPRLISHSILLIPILQPVLAIRWGKEVLHLQKGEEEDERFGVTQERRAGGLEDLVTVGLTTSQASKLIRSPHILDHPHPNTPPSQRECHSDLISAIKFECSSSSNNGISESVKVGVAISLTICSIISALQTPPAECNLWNPYTTPTTQSERNKGSIPDDGDEEWEEGRRGFPRVDGEDGIEWRGRCLEALHRSPQDWSSYNGYLSDATQLCHALSSQQLHKSATDLYKNATREKISLLRIMNEREVEGQRRDLEEREVWEGEMKSLANSLNSLTSTSNQFTSLFRDTSQTHTSLITELAHTLDTLSLGKEEFWNGFTRYSNERLRDAGKEMGVVMSEKGEEVISRLDQRVSTIFEEYFRVLANHQRMTGEVLERQVALAEEKGLEVLDREKEMFLNINHQYTTLLTSLHQTTSSLTTLSTSLQSLAPILTNSLSQASELSTIQQEHLENLKNSNDLSDTLIEGLKGSLDGLQDLEGVVEEMKERFVEEGRRRNGWGSGFGFGIDVDGFGELLKRFLLPQMFTSSWMINLTSNSLFRILFSILTWSITWILSSTLTMIYALTSIWLIFKSGLWRLGRISWKIISREWEMILEEGRLTGGGGDEESGFGKQLPGKATSLRPVSYPHPNNQHYTQNGYTQDQNQHQHHYSLNGYSITTQRDTHSISHQQQTLNQNQHQNQDPYPNTNPYSHSLFNHTNSHFIQPKPKPTMITMSRGRKKDMLFRRAVSEPPLSG